MAGVPLERPLNGLFRYRGAVCGGPIPLVKWGILRQRDMKKARD